MGSTSTGTVKSSAREPSGDAGSGGGSIKSLTERVRASCAYVAQQARLVRICDERIASYARELPVEQEPSGLLLPFQPDSPRDMEAIAAYVLTLDSINFGSGYFPQLRKRPGCSGYRTIEAALLDRFRTHGPLSVRELRTADEQVTASIFDQDPDHSEQSALMKLFARAWNDLGVFLTESFSGSWSAVIQRADQSAVRLAECLTRMPLFRDEVMYRGERIAFYKRAQIAPADLALAFSGKGLGAFEDLDQLTSFADNLVPHVLRMDGVLEYADSLAESIRRGELIPSGSEAEVEIRACAVNAIERMVGERLRQGVRTTATRIDHLLWNRGQGRSYKSYPRHRTRTVFY